jgi:hypothetical protein
MGTFNLEDFKKQYMTKSTNNVVNMVDLKRPSFNFMGNNNNQFENNQFENQFHPCRF